MASEVAPILVTGASGYIASHVVQQLLKAGHRVRGTVRNLQSEKKVKPLRELFPDATHPLELVEADLLDAESWTGAVHDCEYVLHVASPFPNESPQNEDEVIKPAVDGTLNVLKACQVTKTVKRVVLTSSVASVGGAFDVTGSFTENDWTDLQPNILAYAKSKTLAEKAAWDFVKQLPVEEKFELATINPGYVMGPVLCGSYATSMEVPKRMLEHAMPLLPRINFAIVDVRDVAKAHINAMTVPEAAGNRHLVVGGNLWMAEIAAILDKEFHSQGYSVPTKVAPSFLLKMFSWFDKSLRMVVPMIGVVQLYDNARMKNVLGVQPTNISTTVLDMAYTMIEGGFVKRTQKYKGPPSEV